MSAGDERLVWYFAYGSNLDPRTFLGRRRMQAREVRRVRLDGYRLIFDLPVGPGERAVANLRAEAAAFVHGVVWRISEQGAAHLDRTEGVHRGYYARRAVTVVGEDEAALPAFTYVSPHGRPGRKPSARYLGLLLSGARHHGLPEVWIRHLRGFELAVDERSRQGELFQAPGDPNCVLRASPDPVHRDEFDPILFDFLLYAGGRLDDESFRVLLEAHREEEERRS